MAVDANILIFERVREERRRGREVMQSYKNGYENAFSTIVDANLTTLITGIILFKVGRARSLVSLQRCLWASLPRCSPHWSSPGGHAQPVFVKRAIKDVKMAPGALGR